MSHRLTLSYLRQFALDTLKVDRSFVQNIHSAPDDAVIAGRRIRKVSRDQTSNRARA